MILPIAPNRLRDTPVPARRDAVGVADLTCADPAEGWLYVAMDDTLATSLPLAALDMARQPRRPSVGLGQHSDRGVQYASAAGVPPSMSRTGNGYDNAARESFWSSRKRELAPRVRYATRAETRADVFAWIEIFDNRARLPSARGFPSPVDFEQQLHEKAQVSMHSPSTCPPIRGKANLHKSANVCFHWLFSLSS